MSACPEVYVGTVPLVLTDQENVHVFEILMAIVKQIRVKKAEYGLTGTVPVVLRVRESLMTECIGYIERLAKVKVIVEFVGDKE